MQNTKYSYHEVNIYTYIIPVSVISCLYIPGISSRNKFVKFMKGDPEGENPKSENQTNKICGSLWPNTI